MKLLAAHNGTMWAKECGEGLIAGASRKMKGLMERFEAVMIAAAFAEEGEFATALEEVFVPANKTGQDVGFTTGHKRLR